MATNRVTVVPATHEHAVELAPSMRCADVEEVFESHGLPPLMALMLAIDLSDLSRAVLLDGRVAAVYGVAPLDANAGLGSVWLLTGALMDEHPFVFPRALKSRIPELLSKYERLTNHIDARNERAVRWARWCGCEVQEAVPYGRTGRPFHPIELRRV